MDPWAGTGVTAALPGCAAPQHFSWLLHVRQEKYKFLGKDSKLSGSLGEPIASCGSKMNNSLQII